MDSITNPAPNPAPVCTCGTLNPQYHASSCALKKPWAAELTEHPPTMRHVITCPHCAGDVTLAIGAEE